MVRYKVTQAQSNERESYVTIPLGERKGEFKSGKKLMIFCELRKKNSVCYDSRSRDGGDCKGAHVLFYKDRVSHKLQIYTRAESYPTPRVGLLKQMLPTIFSLQVIVPFKSSRHDTIGVDKQRNVKDYLRLTRRVVTSYHPLRHVLAPDR